MVTIFLAWRTLLEVRFSSGHWISLVELEYFRDTPAQRATAESGFQSLKRTSDLKSLEGRIIIDPGAVLTGAGLSRISEFREFTIRRVAGS